MAAADVAPDLRFVLEEEGVAAATITSLGNLGHTTLRLFAFSSETRQQLKDLARTDLGLDPAADAATRLAVAKLVAAWEAAKVRVESKSRQDAEAAASNLPRQLPRTDALALRKAFQARWHVLEDKAVPHHGLLESLEE